MGCNKCGGADCRAISGEKVPDAFVTASKNNITQLNEQKGTRVLNVPNAPGAVELTSPDCFTIWRVIETQEDREFVSYYRTGPATSELIYLKGGGSIYGIAVLQPTPNVRQEDGLIDWLWATVAGVKVNISYPQSSIASSPLLRARFFPCMGPNDIRRVRGDMVVNFVGGAPPAAPGAVSPYSVGYLLTGPMDEIGLGNAVPLKVCTGLNRLVKWKAKYPIQLGVSYLDLCVLGAADSVLPLPAQSEGEIYLGHYGVLWWLGNPSPVTGTNLLTLIETGGVDNG